MNNYIGNGKWKTSSGLAFWGSSVQSVFNFIGIVLVMYLGYNLTDIILGGILPSVASMSLDYYEDRFAGFIGGAVICFIIAFFGYLFYMIGICLFKGAQRSQNAATKAGNIMLAEFIMPVIIILFYVAYYTSPKLLAIAFDSPIATGVTLCVLFLMSVIIPLVEFKSLTKEDTWSETARKGADDLKFSYSCVLWILVIFVFAAGLTALVIYSSITKLYSVSYSGYDKFGNAVERITSVAQETQNLVGTIKVIMMFVCIFAFIFFLLQTIYRIAGWNKIKRGGNEEVYQFIRKGGASTESAAVENAGNSSSTAIGSTDVVESGKEGLTQKLSSGITVVYEEEKIDNNRRWLLWGGIAAGIIAIAAGLWALCAHSDNIKSNANVFADRSIVFKSVEDGVGIEPLVELSYEKAVETKPSEYDTDGVWTKVAFENDGKVTVGYMAKGDLLNSDDFLVLHKGGMSDNVFRENLPYNIERRALLLALKSRDDKWHLEGVNAYGRRQANSKRITVNGISPSEDCLGFILCNSENNDRIFYLYSTPDLYNSGNTKAPFFLHSEPVVGDAGLIYDVNYYKNRDRYEVIYETSTEEDNSEDFLYEGSAMDEDEPEPVTENVWWGQIELNGYIDGQYPVKMDLTMYDGGNVEGTIRYLKYNVPMGLTGTFTDSDESRDISLDERDGDKITGNFIGRYDGRVFSGSWVSADGAKEMPFRVER